MNTFFHRAVAVFWKLLFGVLFLVSLAMVWIIIPHLFYHRAWISNSWPINESPVTVFWQQYMFFAFALSFQILASMYLIASVLMKGSSGAPEVRNRMATFLASVVVGVSLTFGILIVFSKAEPPSDLSEISRGAEHYHFYQYVVCISFPLIAAYSVHSAIYCLRGLHQLCPCWRNTVARRMVVVILCAGLVAMIVSIRLATKVEPMSLAELADMARSCSMETDRTTARLASECPDNYQIQIMRACWLQDHGQTNAADAIYRHVRANTNLSAYVRSWLDAQLASRLGTNAATLRPAGEFGVR